MHNFPESQSVPAADHAEASSGALSDRVFEAGPPGVEAGSCGPISATSTKRPLEAVPPKSAQTVGGQPEKRLSQPPPQGLFETLREGLPGAPAQGGRKGVDKGSRKPAATGGPEALAPPSLPEAFPEPSFAATPYPGLPPIVDLAALPSRSPSQIALAHRPWERSTGPRSEEGKMQAALNGKSRQIGLLSVRELRQYKKGQKTVLESLNLTLILAREINRLFERMVGERENPGPQK